MSDVETTEVRRETTFPADPEELWRAISDEEMLERWLGEEVELDPVEGGGVRVVTDGDERTGRVDEVEVGRRLAFTWSAPGKQESSVELTIAPDPGGARLIVVESPVGPVASAADWSRSLSALRDCLALVPA